MAKVKEALKGKSVDSIEQKIKRLQEEKAKLEAANLMKLGKLTIQFYREGFQDFEKFQDAVRGIYEQSGGQDWIRWSYAPYPFFIKDTLRNGVAFQA